MNTKTKQEVAQLFIRENAKTLRLSLIEESKAKNLTALSEIFSMFESYDARHDRKEPTTIFDYLTASYLGIQSHNKMLFSLTENNTILIVEAIHALTPDEEKSATSTETALKYLYKPNIYSEELMELAKQINTTFPVDEVLAVYAITGNKGGFSRDELSFVNELLSKVHLMLIERYVDEHLTLELAQESNEVNWLLTTFQSFKKAKNAYGDFGNTAKVLSSTLTILNPKNLFHMLGVYGDKSVNLTQVLLANVEVLNTNGFTNYIVHRITPELLEMVESKMSWLDAGKVSKDINAYVVSFAINYIMFVQSNNVKEYLINKTYSQLKYPITTLLKRHKNKKDATPLQINLLPELLNNPAEVLRLEAEEPFDKKSDNPVVQLLTFVTALCFTANIQKLLAINYLPVEGDDK